MLRIPSTRNTALIGRKRLNHTTTTNLSPSHEVADAEKKKIDIDVDVDMDMKEVVKKYGGAEGWEGNALKLVSGVLRGH